MRAPADSAESRRDILFPANAAIAASPSQPASQVIRCGRCHLALVARSKCALHGGCELLVHLLQLLGRIGADMVAGLRGLAPKL